MIAEGLQWLKIRICTFVDKVTLPIIIFWGEMCYNIHLIAMLRRVTTLNRPTASSDKNSPN
jgi:hypothetical protein